MSRKNKELGYLLLPLILLREIGDLLIATIVYIFLTFYEAYKLILFLIFKIIHLPRLLFLIFFKFLKRLFIINKKTFKHSINQNQFIKKKKELRNLKRKVKLLVLQLKFFLFGGAFIGLSVLIIQFSLVIKNLPNPKQILIQGFPATTKIYDRNGILLYEIYDNYNRTPVALKQIPKLVIEATLAAEDKEFYIHNGISIRGIARALMHNVTYDSLEGGSTITQQLIRSSYLTPEKTYFRKIKEIILSIWIEQIYSKDQILEMYLNQIPYGGTTWGIEEAANSYFGKEPKELSLAETAFLAGLPASPSKYSPFSEDSQSGSSNYKKRTEAVLKRMLDEKFISKNEYKEARDKDLVFRQQRVPIAAPHFVMYVREILNKYYGRRLTETGGLRVITSLDLKLQEKTQNTVSEEIEKLKYLQVSNGAVLITNPANGEILSMVGSIDYFDKDNDGNVNVTLAKRPPGSSIKVVNYATALQNGFTAATLIKDSPISFKTGQEIYKPVNYDGKFHGTVTLRTALGSSLNIPAVKILNSIGVNKMIEAGKKMGIDTWNNPERYGLSLTLGGAEVTMTDMAEVYGTLANGGFRKNLNPILQVSDYNGRQLPLPIEKPVSAIPETVAFIISNILADNDARTLAFGQNSTLNIPGKKVSVKTGTSDNKRDNWTIGYTKDFVVTVWVGNNDNSPMNPKLASGITGAAPVWRKLMDLILKDYPFAEMIKPSGVVAVKCNLHTEYFIEGTITENPCKKKFIAKK